jgi:hypothetical protein
MTNRVLLSILSLLLAQAAFGDDFLRNLPGQELLQKLTPAAFKNQDGVIILREQSFKFESSTQSYGGLDYSGFSTTRTEVTIAKLFNEAAVRRFGNFELVFQEHYGKMFKSGFTARARVLKSDGSVWTMPESDVQLVTAWETSDGEPGARKALFVIPNLSAGDVVQIEYCLTQPFVYSSGAIFYYSDQYPVLYSNLYITVPRKFELTHWSFPAERIPPPVEEEISQSLGAGNTYFWSVRNLAGIRKESFARPFAEQSLITCFAAKKIASLGTEISWNKLARDYVQDYLDKDDLSPSRYKELGLADAKSVVTLATVDSLYTLLRQKFRLQIPNSIYPQSRNLRSVIDSKKGDASDLAYIMERILHHWKVDVTFLWLRDRREGVYESSVPLLNWFDRLALQVTVGGQTRTYDFDRSLPTHYVQPWYLASIDAQLVFEKSTVPTKMPPAPPPETRPLLEEHHLHFTPEIKMTDTVELTFQGAMAQRYRESWYEKEKSEILKEVREIAKSSCLVSVDSTAMNDIFEEPAMHLRAIGISKSVPEKIDSFLTFALTSHLLQEFRDKLYSPVRKNHIALDESFEIQARWDVELPAGYAVAERLSDRTFLGPQASSASVHYETKERSLKVKASMTIPVDFVEMRQYADLGKFVDDLVKELNRNIVLKLR